MRRLDLARLGFLGGTLLLSVVFLSILATRSAVGQSETLFLADPAFSNRERPGVLFDHGFHMVLADCIDCHHVYENGRNIWEYGMETRCSACHEAGDRGRLGLRRAWHGQCLGCHEEQPATGRAPVMCGACHVRNSAGGKP